MQRIKAKIRTIPHWPKQGIMFRDITTLLKDPEGMRMVIDFFVQRYAGMKFDKIVGIESRGFILGGAIAHQLGKGFIPIRKPGKLPGETVSQEYELEYGKDKIEMHKDAIDRGDKIVLIDDLLATGGTAMAAIDLIEKLGGEIVETGFVIDLPDVGGRKRMQDAGKKYFYMVDFEGD